MPLLSLSTRSSSFPRARTRCVASESVSLLPLKLRQGFDNLVARISRLSALHPIAVSVTWGAGGSTSDRSLDLAGFTQSECGIDTILHLTCTNMLPGMVDDALRVRHHFIFPRA